MSIELVYLINLTWQFTNFLMFYFTFFRVNSDVSCNTYLYSLLISLIFNIALTSWVKLWDRRIDPRSRHSLRRYAMSRNSQQSLVHSGHFYSASSSPLLLRGAPDTARIVCRSFTPMRHRQLWVKDLPKVPTWRLERDSKPATFQTKDAESTNESPRPAVTIKQQQLVTE